MGGSLLSTHVVIPIKSLLFLTSQLTTVNFMEYPVIGTIYIRMIVKSVTLHCLLMESFEVNFLYFVTYVKTRDM